MKITDNDAAAQPGALLSAFEAGLKSQIPVEAFPGQWVHHKDFQIADKSAQHLAEIKRSNTGPFNPAGTLTLLTMESFCLALGCLGESRTKVFANAPAGMITAFFDFLEKRTEELDSTVLATGTRNINKSGWGQFRANIEFKESRKLKEWRKTLEWMSQADFANFLEDHLEDVVDPSGQDLLSMATDLEASSHGSFKGKVNMQNGNTVLAYQNETETSVEIPRTVALGIPLFEHGDRYNLKTRLRYQVGGGSVKFKLLFTNLDDAKEQEFERIVQEIEAKALIAIYRGSLSLPW